jgi:hypothetical protein
MWSGWGIKIIYDCTKFYLEDLQQNYSKKKIITNKKWKVKEKVDI